jgi:hypothetical protein
LKEIGFELINWLGIEMKLMREDNKIRHALLPSTELEWLLGRIRVSKQYEYRIKSDIRKKVKILQ